MRRTATTVCKSCCRLVSVPKYGPYYRHPAVTTVSPIVRTFHSKIVSDAPKFNDYQAQINENLRRIRQDDHEYADEDLVANCLGLGLETKVEKFQVMMRSRNAELRQQQVEEFRKVLWIQPQNVNRWSKVIWQSPELIQVLTAKQLTAFVDYCIVDVSLSKAVTFNILGCVRSELIEQPEVYKSVILNWVALCEFYELPIAATLGHVPDILHVDPVKWSDRIEDLKEFFVGKQYLGQLIKNNPEVLTMWYTQLKAVLDFMIRVMHVDAKDISMARVVDCDLVELKKRHFFLERCGLYKHPSAKALGSTKSAEPPIKDIVQSSTEEFVGNVVGNGLTVEEYESFVKTLLEEELYPDQEDMDTAVEVESLSADEGFYDEAIREDAEEEVQRGLNYGKARRNRWHSFRESD